MAAKLQHVRHDNCYIVLLKRLYRARDEAKPGPEPASALESEPPVRGVNSLYVLLACFVLCARSSALPPLCNTASSQAHCLPSGRCLPKHCDHSSFGRAHWLRRISAAAVAALM